MKFGLVKTAEAQGAVLAHSLQIGPKGAGKRIAKGTVLGAAHITDLQAACIEEVVAAVLEAGDLDEDATALRLAQALVPDPSGQYIRLTGAGAGRVNLYAASCGIVALDAARINALNAIDPMITVATVPDHARVDAGGMIATIKIISYAVAETLLEQAEAAAGAKGFAGEGEGGGAGKDDGAGNRSGAGSGSGAAPVIRVLPPAYASATLIETATAGMAVEDMSDKGRAATAGRLARFDATLTPRVITAHREAPLAEAIQAATGEMILILTASATSDPRDVAPQALRRAGGEVIRFGMPVDPGNLLFVGRLGEKPVIGLPGCARSIALNGADWVLERLMGGLCVGSADIAAMGVGGLLKEIPTRPRPRRDADG